MKHRILLIGMGALVVGFGVGLMTGLTWSRSLPVSPSQASSGTRQTIGADSVPAHASTSAGGAEQQSDSDSAERKPVEGPADDSARVADLMQTIRQMQSDPETPGARYLTMLRKLAGIGSEEAIGALAELMRDPTLEFDHRANFFSMALRELDDERFGKAAHELVVAQLAKGETSAHDVAGYLELAARCGGVDEQRYVAELMASGIPTLAHSASVQTAELEGSVESAELIRLAYDNPAVAAEILSGLASWTSASVSTDLKLAAFDPDAPLRLRTEALESLFVRDAELAMSEAVNSYWGSERAIDKRVVLGGLSSQPSSDQAERDRSSSQAQPIVLDVLASSDPDLVNEAVYLIRDDEFLLTAPVRAALSALVAQESLSPEPLATARGLVQD